MKLQQVVLIDPYPIGRESLVSLINAEPYLEVAGEGGSASEAARLMEQNEPDLAILELTMEENEGVEVVHRLASDFPSVALLIHTDQPEHAYAEAAIRAGARGYVSKRAPWTALRKAIDRVLDGRIHLSENAANSILGRLNKASAEPPDAYEMLSPREQELLELLGQGYRPSEIAAAMRITVRTFESYSARVRAKLNLTDSRELLRAAIARGKRRHLLR